MWHARGEQRRRAADGSVALRAAAAAWAARVVAHPPLRRYIDSNGALTSLPAGLFGTGFDPIQNAAYQQWAAHPPADALRPARLSACLGISKLYSNPFVCELPPICDGLPPIATARGARRAAPTAVAGPSRRRLVLLRRWRRGRGEVRFVQRGPKSCECTTGYAAFDCSVETAKVDETGCSGHGRVLIGAGSIRGASDAGVHVVRRGVGGADASLGARRTARETCAAGAASATRPHRRRRVRAGAGWGGAACDRECCHGRGHRRRVVLHLRRRTRALPVRDGLRRRRLRHGRAAVGSRNVSAQRIGRARRGRARRALEREPSLEAAGATDDFRVSFAPVAGSGDASLAYCDAAKVTPEKVRLEAPTSAAGHPRTRAHRLLGGGHAVNGYMERGGARRRRDAGPRLRRRRVCQRAPQCEGAQPRRGRRVAPCVRGMHRWGRRRGSAALDSADWECELCGAGGAPAGRHALRQGASQGDDRRQCGVRAAQVAYGSGIVQRARAVPSTTIGCAACSRAPHPRRVGTPCEADGSRRRACSARGAPRSNADLGNNTTCQPAR